MESPNATFLRMLLDDLSKAPFPFAHSRFVLEMPNNVAPIDELEAIRRYAIALKEVEATLAGRSLGTLADVPGLPMFISPIVGASIPSHRLVVGIRDGGEAPRPVDDFEGLGSDDINFLASGVEVWLNRPTFSTVDLEAEIRASNDSLGDALFALRF